MFYFSRAEQAALFLLLALLLLGAGALTYAKGQHSVSLGAEEPVFVPAPGEGPRGELVVDVSGGVARPGLYALPAGSRLADAIARAGGQVPGASTDSLNLAARLRDGEKVVLPEPLSARPTPSEKPAAAPSPGRPLSLNKASAKELEALPGIGPVYAERIVAYRRQKQQQEGHGFRSVEELLNVPGIGPKRFSAIREVVAP
jgi:competence protein ComEA